jgi:oligopeptide transport system ATP-binding protein
MVEIPEPDTRIDSYPHQFSGGMRQRAMIAMAISCNPKLLIADEPTTALDVTIQAQILDLLKRLKDQFGLSVMLITHDLGVIAEACNKVIVMYSGMIMEKASVDELFDQPQHPYTRGLLQSVPKHGPESKNRLIPIDGTPPDLLSPPEGCPFSPRCPHAMEICLKKASPMVRITPTQEASCWLHHPDAPNVEGIVKVGGDQYE